MSDRNIAQIYAFGRDSFLGGQHNFQIEAYPFRMTKANMNRYRNDKNFSFWQMLKLGYDSFEANKRPPKVDVCEKRYVFNVNSPTPLTPDGLCPQDAAKPSTAPIAYQTTQTSQSIWSIAGVFGQKKPLASIAGLKEARLVADWSRKRASGQIVSREPPSLTTASAEPAGAPDIAPPMLIPTKPYPIQRITTGSVNRTTN